jgi:hypothetical protein
MIVQVIFCFKPTWSIWLDRFKFSSQPGANLAGKTAADKVFCLAQLLQF